MTSSVVRKPPVYWEEAVHHDVASLAFPIAISEPQKEEKETLYLKDIEIAVRELPRHIGGVVPVRGNYSTVDGHVLSIPKDRK